MQRYAKEDITIVMPYWERLEVTNDSLNMWYGFEGDVNIIVVDDGSPHNPFSHDKAKVISLPVKHIAKTPVVPYNVGVSFADTELILISGCDIRTNGPILDKMLEAFTDDHHYVQTAVKGPKNRWHAHSSYTCEYFPSGFNPNFCSLMRKDVFMACGGFCLSYRDGQAFDDTDFAWKLKLNEVIPVQLDEIVCSHVKKGARSHWPAGAWQRNREILTLRWGI